MPASHKVVDRTDAPNGGLPKLDWKANVAHFTIPDEITKYEDVIDRVMRGEAVIRYEEKQFTPEGDFIVVVCYLTPLKPTSVAKKRSNDDDEELIES